MFLGWLLSSIKIDELGWVVIPIELRRTLGVAEKILWKFLLMVTKSILQKYKSQQACMITGDVSDKNISLVGGKIVLSPEGAETIIQELHQYLVK
ncbi:AbrB/MazE/SpoVT family DNA-binding domain-containing protein [Bacillus cytotoxicus]|nr:AbrB/MazE/SpoVT family DNA-binding domain-containing protein [Bacillus cytotoxicus]